MSRTRGWLRWGLILAVVTAVELTVRFAVPFRLERVLVVEAVLFSCAAASALALMLRRPGTSRRRRTLQWLVVWSLVLGALRAAIWAAGQPVSRANMVILVVALVMIARTRMKTETWPRGEP